MKFYIKCKDKSSDYQNLDFYYWTKCFCGKCSNFDSSELNHFEMIPLYKIDCACPIHLIDFNEFCLNCEKNVCTYCDEHDNHEIISYRNDRLKNNDISKYYSVIKDDSELNKIKELVEKIIKEFETFLFNF